MKKTVLAALLACLLLLAACQSQETVENGDNSPAPTPTQSQEVNAPPVQSPAEEIPPAEEDDILPDFLREFVFTHFDTLIPEGGWLAFLTRPITPADRAELLDLIALDTWWMATDIPPMGMESCDTLYDDEGHLLVFGFWDEEKCLILARDGEEDYLYFAPVWVTQKVAEFAARKAFLPDFILDFAMNQIEIATDPDAREPDLEVYVLDKGEKDSLLEALDTETWTFARGDEVAVEFATALTVRDHRDNILVLAPWNEEKCLINCLFTDGWSRSTNTGTGPAVRYWAPATVLENVLALVDGLTPLGSVDSLGVIDPLAARYYDLFDADPGFKFVIPNTADDTTISDDDMAAYMLTVLGYNGLIDYEVGVSPSVVDEITVQYFGKTMRSYDTSWSMVFPTGNVTATGWDTQYSRFPVLIGTPDIAEDGTVTATFRIYELPESMWLDELLPDPILRHVREYLLTGNDSFFPMDQDFFSLHTVEITFRIMEENGREYPFYESLRWVG